MLRNLIIRNYALIEHLDLEFGPGLTIITGETGAGKSIMLGALSLVMGGRADTKVISDGNSKSVVEAVFTNVDEDLKKTLEEKGVDWIINDAGISELTVRREISASGRSKVFVNDTSVTVQTLALIMPSLIDIHSQHSNVKINNPSERLRIIDSLADNEKLRNEYKTLFTRYASLRREINALKESLSKTAENIDFIKFRLEQLDRLNPKKGELQEIEKRYELLSDADEIKEKIQKLLSILNDSEGGIQSLLNQGVTVAQGVDEPIESRLRDMAVEAKDIFGAAEDLYSSIDSDPAELTRLSSRISDYYECLKRFRIAEADELVTLREGLKKELDSAEGDNRELPEKEKEAKRLAGELRQKADELTLSRKRSASGFSELLRKTASPLGLPNIQFETQVDKVKLNSTGQDEIEFLSSFNRNSTLRPIGDIASGGEISRLMLSLKSILAGHLNLPTIIFDEVDTGVSGEIADKMGVMMHDMASKMQVIVITHLPQVAAKGNAHFKVFKTDENEKTLTRVEQLDREGRIRELAAMISGSEVSGAAIAAARELLDN